MQKLARSNDSELLDSILKEFKQATVSYTNVILKGKVIEINLKPTDKVVNWPISIRNKIFDWDKNNIPTFQVIINNANEAALEHIEEKDAFVEEFVEGNISFTKHVQSKGKDVDTYGHHYEIWFDFEINNLKFDKSKNVITFDLTWNKEE